MNETKKWLSSLSIHDTPGSSTVKTIINELAKDEYGLNKMAFAPGDVVLDVGANVGVVSLYLGLKYPDIRILAFEPIRETYEALLRNLSVNKVTNVEPYNVAVWSKCKPVWIGFAPEHSGGSSMFINVPNQRMAPAISMQQVFELVGWSHRVRLLKMDIEGAEHGIVRYTGPSLWRRVDYLTMEIHSSELLRTLGYTKEETTDTITRSFEPYQILSLNYLEM